MSTLRDQWRYVGADPAIDLFGSALRMFGFELPYGARVLELGCCETDFARWLKQARPDVQVTGVDWRPCPEFPGDVFVQADASRLVPTLHAPGTIPEVFPLASFDAVLALGAVEHFGLGYYGDPIDADGDRQALDGAARLVTPTGWIYYDVPFTPGPAFRTNHWRCYNLAALDRRLTPDGFDADHLWATADACSVPILEMPSTPAVPFYYVARYLWPRPQH